MKRPIFDKTFWRFLLSFAAILAVAFFVLIVAAHAEGGTPPAA